MSICDHAEKQFGVLGSKDCEESALRRSDECSHGGLGVAVITVWECELRKGAQLEEKLDALAEEARNAGELKKIREGENRQKQGGGKKRKG